uniref:Uncharacterized protein n=1 Tax=Meloidogyne enterolobii TaxID=390850 RepID=A0A6V7WFW1_MELEN|nr:unnamed protein product [Meloidogyne enterolobii]
MEEEDSNNNQSNVIANGGENSESQNIKRIKYCKCKGSTQDQHLSEECLKKRKKFGIVNKNNELVLPTHVENNIPFWEWSSILDKELDSNGNVVKLFVQWTNLDPSWEDPQVIADCPSEFFNYSYTEGVTDTIKHLIHHTENIHVKKILEKFSISHPELMKKYPSLFNSQSQLNTNLLELSCKQRQNNRKKKQKILKLNKKLDENQSKEITCNQNQEDNNE